jgi:uncharacterized membrane protein YgdD (TMEM256/DUF423 family)
MLAFSSPFSVFEHVKRNAIAMASVLGFLGVAIGAFGAHALHDQIAVHGRQEKFATATLYHLVHALLLMVIGMLYPPEGARFLRIAAAACTIGIFVFSGSLYILSLTGLDWLGAITPIGGLGFLTAWLCILLHALTHFKTT